MKEMVAKQLVEFGESLTAINDEGSENFIVVGTLKMYLDASFLLMSHAQCEDDPNVWEYFHEELSNINIELSTNSPLMRFY